MYAVRRVWRRKTSLVAKRPPKAQKIVAKRPPVDKRPPGRGMFCDRGTLCDSVRAYSHQRTRVFSAAEILLRIYQTAIYLNGARWRTTFWRQREVRRRKKR